MFLIILAEFKPFVFNDTCPRRLGIRIIDCCISLEIRSIQKFCFKPHGTIFQRAERIIKIRIYRSRIYRFLSQSLQFLFLLQIINPKPDFDSLQQMLNHLCVTTHRNSLIQRIKIIVIKRQAHRKALDNKSRQIRTLTSPLFLCISFDQFLVNIGSHKTDRLFLEIFRFCNACGFFLLLNFRRCFLRCHHTPHLIKGVHIKRKRV